MSETSKKGMQPDDIAKLRQVTDTQVSPDGQSIAFTVMVKPPRFYDTLILI